jgi:hypothetical protein
MEKTMKPNETRTAEESTIKGEITAEKAPVKPVSKEPKRAGKKEDTGKPVEDKPKRTEKKGAATKPKKKPATSKESAVSEKQAKKPASK